jgi:hypothetical protein
MSIYQTIKKYFLLLSIFIVFVISIHLIFLYFSEDAVRNPIEGGTVNVGIIGTVPNLNPAAYGADPIGDYLLRFVSRSLLRYNIETKQMEGDIANCNLGKNFSEIKCYVKKDQKWSDGTPIATEDILATYDMLQNDDINKTAKKVLENITIQNQGEYIEFTGKADVLVLDMLIYPIIQKDIVEKIKNNTFSIGDNLSAGAYIFDKRETDSKSNSEKISFIRNIQNTHAKNYIGRYTFSFFNNKNDLLTNKNSLNIVLPSNTIDSLSSARFDEYKFIFPEYISLFLNADKLDSELRSILLGSLTKVSFASLNETTGKLLKNPFFTDESILPENGDITKIEAIMKRLGYMKKEALITEHTNVKTETKVVNEEISNYIFSPSNKKYIVTKENDILLSGNTPSGITGVYVNDYKLKNYSPKEQKFYYRAKLDIGTMKGGLNTYKIAFEIAGKKVTKEIITIFLATTDEEVTIQEKLHTDKLQSERTNTLAQEEKKAADDKSFTEKVKPLDPAYYYNKDLKKFSLQIAYTEQTPYMKTLATELENHIKTLGIDVQITTLTTEDLQTIITKGEKQYSMILTGINLGLFDYNIFPFFHS